MSIEILRRQLKDKNISGIYLLSGREDYLKNHYLSEIKQAVLKNEDDPLNYISMQYKTLSAEQIYDFVEALPAFNDKKLLQIDCFDDDAIRTDINDAIVAIEKDWPDYCVIILNEQNTDAQNKKGILSDIIKRVKGHILSVAINEQDEALLTGWIMRHAEEYGKSINYAATKYLLSITDNNMNNLACELSKIFAYCKGDTVSTTDIDAVTVKTMDAKIYELTDALLEKKAPLAKALADDLLEKQPDTMVLGAIYSCFLRLYRISLAKDAGMSGTAICSKLGMKSFVLTKNLNILKKVSTQQVRRIIGLCSRTDDEIKRVSRDKPLAIDAFILKIFEML